MPKTLLVVDDSRTIREAARLALTGEDWKVVEASTPSDALQELRTRAPDAVLCDVALTGADGYRLCREIRKQPQGREIAILLMGAKMDEAAATAAGANQTLSKPFSSEDLTEALFTAVELQGFSQGLADGTPPAADAPLTLEELSGPLQQYAEPLRVPAEEPLEIIDLSGEEEFEELELLDDLEPISPPSPAEPRQGLWEVPAPGPEPADSGTFELDLGDILPEAETPSVDLAEPEAEDELTTAFGPEDEEPPAPVALELEPELGLDLDSALHELPEEDQEPPIPWSSSPLDEAAEAAFEPLPQRPLREPPVVGPAEATRPGETLAAEPLDGTVAAAAEAAVREALTRSLSPEALVPIVEAVVERVVWEVVPQLAERLIREAIEKLKTKPPA